MRSPIVGIATLLFALLPSSATADTPDPLHLIPGNAAGVLKVENPRSLYDTIYEHEAFQDFLKLDAVAAFYDTTNIRRVMQFISYLEKELGYPKLELLDRLAGAGVAVGVRFEKKDVLVVVQAKDEELLKKFTILAQKIINQELARQDGNGQIEVRSYRNLETWHLGKEVNFARAGAALLFASEAAVLHKALDLHLDSGKESVAGWPNLTEIKSRLPEKSQVWGTLNIERLKEIPEVKNTLNTLGLDPVTMFAIGGVVDIIKRSPYVCAGLAREGKNLHLRVALPKGRDGMAPLSAMLLPEDDRGSLPLLKPERVLSSTSYFLDLGKFWEDRHKILTPEQAKTVDKFEADTGKYLKGIGLGPILQQAGKYHRFVITTAAESPYKTKPQITSGSFAFVLDMRDPAFAKSMGTVLRGAALFAGFKYGLKMVEEKHAGHTLVTYYFPEKGKFEGDDNNIRFNFSPCFTNVGDQFVISSSLELGKDLVDCLLKETKAGTSDATQRTHVYGTGVAFNLQTAEDLLISQAILSQALPASGAKKQYDEVVRLVERLGQVNFETRYGPHEFRFDILWQYEQSAKK